MALPYLPHALRALVPMVTTILILVAVYVWVPGAALQLDQAWALVQVGDTEGLATWFAQFGWWGPAVIILFMVLQLFLVVFPSWLPMVVAVIGFGPWFGSLIGLVGVGLAGLVGYLVGQQIGAKRFRTLIGEERHVKLCGIVRNYGFGGVMLFRMSPFLATDAVSFVAGVVGMPLRRYLLATLLGTLPMTALIAFFGRDISGLKSGMWWIGGLGLIAYGVFILYRRRHLGTVHDSTHTGPIAVS